ncbi:MAG: flagellin, partial [Azonexus sp.]|nr:flagellin [Azonexus sp.]
GTRLNELDSLANAGENLQLQYKSSLSALQDLDYAKAISDMAQKQMQLEAAQLSFKQISQMSLFSIL